MLLDPLHLIQALFTRVLLCDANGRVLSAIGGPAPATLFEDPGTHGLHLAILDALGGVPFEASLTEPSGSVRVRAIPWRDHPEVRLVVVFEPEVGPANRLRHGGTETSELDFLHRHLRQGLWRLDEDGIIVEANAFLAAWLEVSMLELVGSRADRWRPGADFGDRYEAYFTTTSGRQRRGMVIRSEVLSPGGQAQGVLEIITDVSADHAMKAKLVDEVRRMSRLARTDALTGLSNRLVFEERIRELYDSREPFALILVDLDHLKEINDNRGHASGDRALVEVGNLLREAVRSDDLVSRIGGDEFAILLPSTPKIEAQRICERLRKLVSGSMAEPRTASVGLAHTDDSQDLVSHADEDMYRHKRSRRPRPDIR